MIKTHKPIVKLKNKFSFIELGPKTNFIPCKNIADSKVQLNKLTCRTHNRKSKQSDPNLKSCWQLELFEV